MIQHSWSQQDVKACLSEVEWDVLTHVCRSQMCSVPGFTDRAFRRSNGDVVDVEDGQFLREAIRVEICRVALRVDADQANVNQFWCVFEDAYASQDTLRRRRETNLCLLLKKVRALDSGKGC